MQPMQQSLIKPSYNEPIDLSKDRNKYDKLADLYSIIVTTEHLEIIWARGCCSDDDYTTNCKQLITQYKSLTPVIESYYPNISKFFDDYCRDCHAARNRLVVVGVPATTFHGSSDSKLNDAKGLQLVIAQTVQHFITTIDGLQLNLKAVDEIQPHVKELMENINKVTTLPMEHPSRKNIQQWLLKLNTMKASDELSDDDKRQMSFDMENAYSEFVKFLQGDS